jgi:iron complex transport system ATP-binding protein
MAGSMKVDAGEVLLKGTNIAGYSAKKRASMVAYLTQEALPELPNTVDEIVKMGRYPYQKVFTPWLQKEDDRIIDEVLQFTETISLRSRQVSSLSGGEKQRVAMALALVQEPEILLLDEPTTYLDVYYQLTFFELLREWKKEKQTTIISVLHDINLASLYSDRCFLLKDGKILHSGATSEVITSKNIEQVFGIQPILIPHPEQGVPQVLLKGKI